MEAVKQAPPQVEEKPRQLERRFVPALPTLWPHMLLGRRSGAAPYPFEAPTTRYYYFARNAVWTLARVMGLDKGEVLVPAYHHGVEVEALLDAGCQVRFFRVNGRWGIDPDDVRAGINSRTRAIYLIHFAGFPGPAQELKKLADEHGLPLIEDCALSLLAKDGDRPVGSIGDASIFCLYKTLPVPNGGALCINGSLPRGIPEASAPPAASTMSHLTNQLLMNLELRGGGAGRAVREAIRGLGRSVANAGKVERVPTGSQHFDRDHVHWGMSPVSRRILFAQDFDRIVEARRRNYFFLLSRLRDLAPPVYNQLPPGACPLFFPLRVNDKDKVAAKLAARGIEAINFWSFGHPSCPVGEFPEVDELRRTILEIPNHQDLDQDDMAFVADAVREAVREP